MAQGDAARHSTRTLLRQAFSAAVAAVHPRHCLAAHLPSPSSGRTIVIAAGKAAPAMAQALVDHWHGGPLTGAIVAPRGQRVGDRIGSLDVLEASHPVPDAASVAAGARIAGLLDGLTPDDQVIAFLSGGGSALLVQPARGITLADKQQLSRELLASGTTIAAINCVRRKLSAVKGGHLALRAQPATVYALAISDVPGDDFADIASGPFSPDATTLADARVVIERSGCRQSDAVARRLADPLAETPKPGHPAFARVHTAICARSADALAAAAAVVAAAGYTVLPSDDAVNTDAVALARQHAVQVRAALTTGGRVALISGGETTVRVSNPLGRGGRNTTYLLALAVELQGQRGVAALAADTDGIDGTQDNAGAFLLEDSMVRARELGLDARALLTANDAWRFFDRIDELLVTGPTGTNANDLRIVLIDPPRPM